MNSIEFLNHIDSCDVCRNQGTRNCDRFENELQNIKSKIQSLKSQLDKYKQFEAMLKTQGISNIEILFTNYEKLQKVIDEIRETNIISAILDVVSNKERDLEFYRVDFKEDLEKLKSILSEVEG